MSKTHPHLLSTFYGSDSSWRGSRAKAAWKNEKVLLPHTLWLGVKVGAFLSPFLDSIKKEKCHRSLSLSVTSVVGLNECDLTIVVFNYCSFAARSSYFDRLFTFVVLLLSIESIGRQKKKNQKRGGKITGLQKNLHNEIHFSLLSPGRKQRQMKRRKSRSVRNRVTQGEDDAAV